MLIQLLRSKSNMFKKLSFSVQSRTAKQVCEQLHAKTLKQNIEIMKILEY